VRGEPGRHDFAIEVHERRMFHHDDNICAVLAQAAAVSATPRAGDGGACTSPPLFAVSEGAHAVTASSATLRSDAPRVSAKTLIRWPSENLCFGLQQTDKLRHSGCASQ